MWEGISAFLYSTNSIECLKSKIYHARHSREGGNLYLLNEPGCPPARYDEKNRPMEYLKRILSFSP